MYLRPRVVSKQSPQLSGRELPSTVCLEGKCFQRCTGKVFALCRQVSGDVFGEIKGDPHKTILRGSECRRQPPRRLGRLRSNRRRPRGHLSPLSAPGCAAAAPELAHRPHDADARRYHADEFQNARENYYTDGDQIRGVWYRQLANQWGLVGEVREDQFQRLADGQHPITGEQLVRHQTTRETRNPRGETVTTMEHRAGWDATFSAPKSVSITALVGGDPRVRDAHRESVRVALNELEPYVAGAAGRQSPAGDDGERGRSLV
jgi:hypothetical protein